MGNVIEENPTPTAEEQSNLDRVRSIYRGFLEGQLNEVIGQMTDDVRIVGSSCSRMPPSYARSYDGREAVAAGFAEFLSVVQYQKPTAPVRLLAKGNRVLAIGQDVRQQLQTGELTENRWSMIWTLRDRKVTELRVVEDTVELL